MKNFIKLFIIFCIFFISTKPANSFSYGPEVEGVEGVETLILVDLSSSMLLPTTDGSRIEVAINSAYRLVSQYKNTDKIGLRVIGYAHPISFSPQFFSTLSHALLCKQTVTPIPIGENNITKIRKKLLTLSPFGDTPLEYSLREAIYNDFSNTNNLKHIILITDGGENCGGDPCAFMREVMATRNDIRIDVIAVCLDNQYIPLYDCITDATGGAIINIDNIKDINPTLTKFISPTVDTPKVEYPDIDKDFPDFDFTFNTKPKNNFTFKNYIMEYNEN